MPGPSIVWFRDDLRLADHPALRAAVDRGERVIGLYVFDEESAGVRPLGGAAKWWLHHSLVSLASRLEERGSRLVLRRGPAAREVQTVVRDAGASALLWNRRYGAAERTVDAGIKESLRAGGIEVASFGAHVLFEPWTIQNGSGKPYAVFTPFWRACQQAPAPRAPVAEPLTIEGPSSYPASDRIEDWDLLPTKPDWAGGLRDTWEPGEPAAQARLQEFLTEGIGDYQRTRDEPGAGATSRMSPRLRWGELSVHTIWRDAIEQQGSGAHAGSARRFLSEIGWREFAYHTLYHFPDLATKNWRAEFDDFPWPPLDEHKLVAWQRGRTGVPLVDAGMHELWHTGYMHNRVRMVTASFLVKNLLIDWRLGEQWFWDCLVDADAANNAMGWQWIAGSGVDAAPYFRVFNPLLQAEKFDPDNDYIGQWAPEDLAEDAPPPIVDLAQTRKAAIAAYDRVKRGR